MPFLSTPQTWIVNGPVPSKTRLQLVLLFGSVEPSAGLIWTDEPFDKVELSGAGVSVGAGVAVSVGAGVEVAVGVGGLAILKVRGLTQSPVFALTSQV